jgi:hypothetical protein
MPARAEVSNGRPISQTITLTGVVPEMRMLYINRDGYLVRIIGNTASNIKPEAISLDNKPLAMTDAIRRQYDYFLSQHGWKLVAGVTYQVNPVQVDTSVDRSDITINTASQVLAGNLQLQVGLTPGFGQNG